MQRGEAQSPERIYFNLAMLALENKDFATAEDNFRKAIEVSLTHLLYREYTLYYISDRRGNVFVLCPESLDTTFFFYIK